MRNLNTGELGRLCFHFQELHFLVHMYWPDCNCKKIIAIVVIDQPDILWPLSLERKQVLYFIILHRVKYKEDKRTERKCFGNPGLGYRHAHLEIFPTNSLGASISSSILQSDPDYMTPWFYDAYPIDQTF